MPAALSDSSAVDPTGQHPPRPRLASDGARYAVSTAFTVLVGAGFGFYTQAENPRLVGSLRFVAMVYFGSWALYSSAYVILTWLALRGADGATLRAWLTENRAGRRRRRATERLTGSGGPVGAVTFCAVAIAAVVAAAVLPELREDPVVVGLAVAVVVTTWILIAVVFAVHYAREDAQDTGFDFAGTDPQDPPRLSDYWYLAVQVSAAYNSADVTVTTRHLRTALTAHAVVAFVFNTVLIALLVSLLITVTT